MRTDTDKYLQDVKRYLKYDLNLFTDCDDLITEEISEGNINHVYRVSDNKETRSVIIKLAKPEAVISKDIVIDTLRGEREAEILEYYNRLIPGCAPKVLGYNKELYTVVMSDLKDFGVLQNCIDNINSYFFIPEQLSDFLSDLLFYTSDFYLDAKVKKGFQKRFINPDLCDITEKLVFSQPYINGDSYVSDDNKEFVTKNIVENANLKNNVQELKYKFMTQAQSLIHGDLHFGSVFVNDEKIVIFDPEFSFYGPMGYDIGNIIAHFVIEFWISCSDSVNGESLRRILKEYLLLTVKRTFEKMLNRIRNESKTFSGDFAENTLCAVLRDSSGYAGTECLRRIAGIAKLKKAESLDYGIKSYVEKKILESGILLIERRNEITDCSDFERIINELLK